MQLEDTRWPCHSHSVPGLTLPSLLQHLSPGKALLLSVSCSFQSLPFSEGFLSGALWAAGIRDKVGSFLSKRRLPEGEGSGETGRGSKRSLGTKKRSAHEFSPLPSVFCQSSVRGGDFHFPRRLGGPMLFQLESFEPENLSLMHCSPLSISFLYLTPMKLR